MQKIQPRRKEFGSLEFLSHFWKQQDDWVMMLAMAQNTELIKESTATSL
jgi:hypothetical protein